MASLARPELFPRGPLLAAGGLLAATVLLVLVFAEPGRRAAPEPARPTVSRDLRFADMADGGVRVQDARDGALVATLDPGSDSFIRTTLRSLVRERRMEELGAEAPFRLSAFADGRVTLEDLATGRRLELAAYGKSNLEAFARLLAARGDGRAP